jgi:hypothetical protein
MTDCEQAGVHLPGTGHSQTDCPTLDDGYYES